MINIPETDRPKDFLIQQRIVLSKPVDDPRGYGKTAEDQETDYLQTRYMIDGCDLPNREMALSLLQGKLPKPYPQGYNYNADEANEFLNSLPKVDWGKKFLNIDETWKWEDELSRAQGSEMMRIGEQEYELSRSVDMEGRNSQSFEGRKR
jgi:hypothetical protein